MGWIWGVFFWCIGLAIGSFLNVCIYRLVKEPPENDIIFKPSHCPNCKKRIRWYDNIPVLSYLVLRGRCRDCGWRIPFRYPLVELLSGGIWFFCWYRWGISGLMFSYAIFFSLLLVSVFTDFDCRIIPDEISVGGIVLGLVLSLLFPEIHRADSHLSGLWLSFLGMVAGGGLVFLVAIIGEIIFRKEAMGGGDVKLQAMIGAFLGWKWALLGFFVGCIFGSILGIYRLLLYKDNTLPFGPALVMGAIACMFWGERILRFLFPAFYM